jgi:hypothetical protein
MDGVREVQLGAKDSLSHPLMAKSCRKARRVMIFSCGCSWLCGPQMACDFDIKAN